MISNCDSYPFLSPVMAELDPAICSGASLQMAAKVAGRDEWIAINGKWASDAILLSKFARQNRLGRSVRAIGRAEDVRTIA